MTRHTRRFLGLALLLALVSPRSARAEFVLIEPGTGYYTGVDAGVGPGGLPSDSSQLNSVVEANNFQKSVAGRSSTVIDFGPQNTGLLTTTNDVWSKDAHGLSARTKNLSYTPPQGYQYGLTNADALNNTVTLGYNFTGTHHYTFVPKLNAGTATLKIHSDSAFDSFGFYLTGLGNQGGIVGLAIDDQPITMPPLSGSPSGGVLFLGYVGNKAVHDLTVVEGNVSGPARDVFGISDLRLIAAAPEPSALVVSASGLVTVLGAWVVRRRRRAAG